MARAPGRAARARLEARIARERAERRRDLRKAVVVVSLLIAYYVAGMLCFGFLPPGLEPLRERPARPGEHVERLAVSMHVGANGVASVREVFEYDFGSRPARGFTRSLLESYDRSAVGRGTSGIEVDAPAGARTSVRERNERGVLGDRHMVVRVAAPEGGWTGRQRFAFEYRMRTPGFGHGFVLDAVSPSWPGRVDRLEATVTSDVAMSGVACTWSERDTPCAARMHGSRHVTVVKTSVPSDEGVSVTGSFAGQRVETPGGKKSAGRTLLFVGLPFLGFVAWPLVVMLVHELVGGRSGGGTRGGGSQGGGRDRPDGQLDVGGTGSTGSGAGGVGGY
ncbi:MAG: hypothetical protein GEV10_14825 [Streptosporangiales bacterium]|nr:hypothetical protein [Streptosporangiales bacterium]